MLNRNISKLILSYALWNTQFHLVVFTIFLLSKGLTMEQYFLTHAIGGLVAILAEIPTGSFADRISRKWSLVISSLLHIPLTYLMIVSDSFPVLLFAFALGGLSAAFRSGTDEAILYDTLKALKQELQFKEIIGRMKWYAAWVGAAAGIIGGLLAQIDLSYAWWAWLFIAFPILFIQLSLIEPPLSKEGNEINDSYTFHLKESFRQSFSGAASYFIIYAATISLFFSIGFWLWQPYLELIGLSVALFGFLYAALNIVSGFVSKYAGRIEHKIGMRASLLAVPLIFSLGLLLQSQVLIIWGFLFLLFQNVAGGYLNPILDDYIHSRIPSSKRATILSIKNMTGQLLFIAISPLVGRFVDAASLPNVLGVMGAVLLLVGLIFGLLFPPRLSTSD